ncbi:MAG: hypothetical protein KDD42_01970 [Bdellovibrionales bacterium]|nr:hypothetical protein [Bdellovibrionales bacterium]
MLALVVAFDLVQLVVLLVPIVLAFRFARFSRASLLSMLMLVCAAGILTFRTPFQATDMPITPDSVEYAAGARSLLLNGDFTIHLADAQWPSRYPPFFSANVALPAYLLLGWNEFGNAILAVFCFGLLCVVAAYCGGKLIAGAAGGCLAALLLIALSNFRIFGSQILSDVPLMFLYLDCLLVILLWNRAQLTPSKAALLLGFLSALAFSWKITALGLVLAGGLVVLREAKISALLLFSLWPIAAAMAVFFYNLKVFGSGFRNGYQFWVPWPYDFLSETFSFQYLIDNLIELGESAVPAYSIVLLALMIMDWRMLKSSPGTEMSEPLLREHSRLLSFLLLTAFPLLLCFLLYFYPSERFYLPLEGLLAVLTGGILGAFLLRFSLDRLVTRWLPFMVLLTVVIWRYNYEPANERRLVAEELLRVSSKHAALISNLDPLYIYEVGGRTEQRSYLPLSRNVEYASKAVASLPISYPEPRPPILGAARSDSVLRAGAHDVFAKVALEDFATLKARISKGDQVFVDSVYTRPSERAELERHFELVQVSKRVIELKIARDGPVS